jgi:hypothetical protein
VKNTNWYPLTHNNPIFSNSTPDDSYLIFFNTFSQIFTSTFHLFKPKNPRALNCNTPSTPWMNPSLIAACRKKSRLLKIYNKTKSAQSKLNYSTFRNKLKFLIKKEQKTYYENEFKKRSNNIHSTWQLINELLNKKRSNLNNNKITHITSNGISTSNPTDIANTFIDYFTSIGSSLSNQVPTWPSTFHQFLSSPIRHSAVFLPTDQQEIYNIINNLDNSMTCGDDNIPISVIKRVALYISNPLSLLLNHSFNHGLFPSLLKIAKITPLFKSGSKYDVSNYRPIYLLNGFSKIYERAIYNRISSYLSKFNLLYFKQYGFRTAHSTELALTDLLDSISKAIDDKNYTISITIDLKKAFDTVDHKILLSKLSYYGFRGNIYNLLKDYLSNRMQYVQLADNKSKTLLP